MRMLNPSFAVASLLGFLTAASCTLITDVDRTKIPTDGGTAAAGGTAGDAGSGNEAGTGAEAGSGATGGANGGTGGTNGGTGGTNGGTGGANGGTGGTGTPTKACDKATGRITIGVMTYLEASGDKFTLSDGVNKKVTFEFDWEDDDSDVTGANVIRFSGTPTTAELALLITEAINAAADLRITATTTADVPEAPNNGNGGAGGESGAAGASGAGAGGQGGAGEPPVQKAETIELKNDFSGARGNVTITDTIGNPNFKVSGMSGGKAVLCDTAASCSTDAECDAERSCNSSTHLCE